MKGKPMSNRRKCIVVITAVAVITTGCSVTVQGTGSIKRSLPVVVAPTQNSDDTTFLAVVRDMTTTLEGVSDELLIETAHTDCDALTAGNTVVDLERVIVNSGIDLYDGGIILGAAIAAYCPEFKDQIK